MAPAFFITAAVLGWFRPVAALAEVATIYRDVAIVGGGASGAYSAVRLREDYNLSVVLIEKSNNLVRISQVCLKMLDLTFES